MEQEEEFVSLTSLHFSFNSRLIIHRHRPGSRIPRSQHHGLSARQQSHTAFCSLCFSESHGPCKQLTVAQTRNYSMSFCLTPAKKTRCYGRATAEDLIPPSPSVQTKEKREPTSPPAQTSTNRQALPLVTLWKSSSPLALAHFGEGAELWIMARWRNLPANPAEAWRRLWLQAHPS